MFIEELNKQDLNKIKMFLENSINNNIFDLNISQEESNPEFCILFPLLLKVEICNKVDKKIKTEILFNDFGGIEDIRGKNIDDKTRYKLKDNLHKAMSDIFGSLFKTIKKQYKSGSDFNRKNNYLRLRDFIERRKNNQLDNENNMEKIKYPNISNDDHGVVYECEISIYKNITKEDKKIINSYISKLEESVDDAENEYDLYEEQYPFYYRLSKSHEERAKYYFNLCKDKVQEIEKEFIETVISMNSKYRNNNKTINTIKEDNIKSDKLALMEKLKELREESVLLEEEILKKLEKIKRLKEEVNALENKLKNKEKSEQEYERE